jgi:hypothetical protein
VSTRYTVFRDLSPQDLAQSICDAGYHKVEPVKLELRNRIDEILCDYDHPDTRGSVLPEMNTTDKILSLIKQSTPHYEPVTDAELVEKMAEYIFDHIILDSRFPGYNGFLFKDIPNDHPQKKQSYEFAHQLLALMPHYEPVKLEVLTPEQVMSAYRKCKSKSKFLGTVFHEYELLKAGSKATIDQYKELFRRVE